MKYVDTIELATTTTDGYGDKTVTLLTTAKAVFIQRTGFEHLDHADGVNSDAAVYIDPKNSLVIDNLYRLEGMYIIANPFGDTQNKSWYRISRVTVGQKKLLDNTIDNIYCLLEKAPGVAYVNIVS